ncbi:MAG: rRNA maturation RNase YbeY [Candidatus Acidiferrales bacterium]
MILNRQRRVRVSVPELTKFFDLARRRLRVRSGALTICLVTDAEITRFNRTYRGKKGPTDVLSFPSHGARSSDAKGKPEGKPARGGVGAFSFASSNHASSYLGDIAIAPAVARRNARRFGRSFEDEMRILILHGMLHLMGYDHETDDGRMDRRERRLRRELGIA